MPELRSARTVSVSIAAPATDVYAFMADPRRLPEWATGLGAHVITTASTPQKAAMSRQAGAVEVLDYPGDPAEFGATMRALTDEAGVAAVCDGVGKTTFDATLASLAR